MDKKILEDLFSNALVDRAPGTPEETLETAGCTGGCPTHPGAPVDEMGLPDCSKCPQMNED